MSETEKSEVKAGTPSPERLGSPSDYDERCKNVGRIHGLVATVDEIALRLMKRKGTPLWVFSSLGLVKRNAICLIKPIEEHKNELENANADGSAVADTVRRDVGD